MNEVISMPDSSIRAEIDKEKYETLTKQDIESRRKRREFDLNAANLNPETERKRQLEFETNYRKMQSDYRGENDNGAKPLIIETISKWKFWRFWK